MNETAEVERLTWWRRAGFLRVLLTGLPILAIGAIVIAFWILSLVRSGEYKVLPVGSRAPTFSLITATGGQVSLDQHLGEHPFLMYFNEGVG